MYASLKTFYMYSNCFEIVCRLQCTCVSTQLYTKLIHVLNHNVEKLSLLDKFPTVFFSFCECAYPGRSGCLD